LEAGDLEAAAYAAHSIKSSSASIGARPLAALAGETEKAARSGHAKALAETAGALLAAYAEVVRRLEARLS